MSVARVIEQVNSLQDVNFVSTISPYFLGRLAAKANMEPAAFWTLDMIYGYRSVQPQVRFSEEALANTGWREDNDVDYPQPEVQ